MGHAGYIAEGVVYALAAARRLDTTNASGMAGALSTLKQQHYGQWLLGTVAAALISYGFFQIIKQPFRQFRAS